MIAVQNKVPFPLWVALPHFVGNLAVPVALSVFANEAKSALNKASGVEVKTFFYGGHSLGGSSVSTYVDGEKGKDSEGAFAWGAYVSRKIKDPAQNYPSPFLTVGA